LHSASLFVELILDLELIPDIFEAAMYISADAVGGGRNYFPQTFQNNRAFFRANDSLNRLDPSDKRSNG
jgi:hypothetical protein